MTIFIYNLFQVSSADFSLSSSDTLEQIIMALLYNLLTLSVLSTILLHTCYAGPAGQLALAVRSASKVPRSIRASFRNPEIGVARGFGKRSQQTSSKSLSSRDLVNFFAFPFLSVSTHDKNHERTLRRGRRTRFKLNDHELRISRGFGKRSIDSVSSKSCDCKRFSILTFFSAITQNLTARSHILHHYKSFSHLIFSLCCLFLMSFPLLYKIISSYHQCDVMHVSVLVRERHDITNTHQK